ncbi:MAG: exopolysaccharide biosynthesis protein [Bacilli bacterium]|nr:exopolysaccharide biosynthesis protein [Bacilli bacterium]
MILVTLGTQDKSFSRLLDAVQKQINDGVIKEEVIVQAGYTKYKSDNMKIFDYIPIDKFDELISNCDLLITHAGVGSIVTAIKKSKKVIAAARLAKYQEHTNDHQLQIAQSFDDAGYIIHLKDFDKLGDILKSINKFKPKKFKSNKENFVNNLKNYIDNN